MPELPEVETVVRTLEHQLGNCTIKKVHVLYKPIVDNMNADEFEKRLVNQKIEQYSRRGKYLIFTLNSYILIAHLRMEGKFFVYKEHEEAHKHTHVVFELENGELHYNDVRKFGRFYLYSTNEPLSAIEQLGKEPFDPTLDADYCTDYCAKTSLPIKSILLDQHMIAGIGNIYADEICYASAINPHRCAALVSREKWTEIIDNTKRILDSAIKAGGTTIRSYTSSLGVTGLFQLSLSVHTLKECTLCGCRIIKDRIGGRGTYWCPKCQKDRPITVAISGTIGSGKSQLMIYGEKMHIPCISCDEINARLLEDKKIKEELASVLKCDKELIDKPYLASRIFTDAAARKKVETLLHARILEKIRIWISEHEDEKLLLIEVPLLFEAGWDAYFDANILVWCDEKTALKRLLGKRKMCKEDALRRISAQMPFEKKKEKARWIIENNSSLSALKNDFRKTIDAIMKMNENRKQEKL